MKKDLYRNYDSRIYSRLKTGSWGKLFVQTLEYINPKKHNAELWSLTVENGLTPKTERYQKRFFGKKRR